MLQSSTSRCYLVLSLARWSGDLFRFWYEIAGRGGERLGALLPAPREGELALVILLSKGVNSGSNETRAMPV